MSVEAPPRLVDPSRDRTERRYRRMLDDAGPIVHHLRSLPARTRAWSWVGPLAVTGAAAVFRMTNLDHPHALMFDETYYVRDAFTLDHFGFATDWDEMDEDNPHQFFIRGDHREMTDTPSFVVHGDMGKWLIALSMRMFGADNGLGWRFTAALAGVLTVLMVGRIAFRLFGSPLLATTASTFIALDGTSIAHSRTAILDGFLTAFVVAAFWMLLMDHLWVRRRLARALARQPDPRRDPWGPAVGLRWWLGACGVTLGAAAGITWSAFYVAAAFGIAAFLYDVVSRRALGIRWPIQGGIMRGGFPAAMALIPSTILAYIATWFSWFRSDGSYLHTWAADLREKGEAVPRGWLPDSFNSWLEFQLRIAKFHVNLESEHSALSNPWGWLLQIHPTHFYLKRVTSAEGASCGASECVERITSVGNPALWWAGFLALAIVIWVAVRTGDLRAWLILAGYAGTYLPWLLGTRATVFTFYTVVIAPFVALALTFAVGLLLQRVPLGARPSPYSAPISRGPAFVQLRGSDTATRRVGWGVYGVVVGLVILLGLLFLPVWTGIPIPDAWYQALRWLPRW